jgi:hypothetical protein
MLKLMPRKAMAIGTMLRYRMSIRTTVWSREKRGAIVPEKTASVMAETAPHDRQVPKAMRRPVRTRSYRLAPQFWPMKGMSEAPRARTGMTTQCSMRIPALKAATCVTP